MYSTANRIFHFSYLGPDYPTSGLARVYCNPFMLFVTKSGCLHEISRLTADRLSTRVRETLPSNSQFVSFAAIQRHDCLSQYYYSNTRQGVRIMNLLQPPVTLFSRAPSYTLSPCSHSLSVCSSLHATDQVPYSQFVITFRHTFSSWYTKNF
jgi:hypothetical protein